MASGTYSYDEAEGVLLLDTTSSDFDCSGPEVGQDTLTVISLSQTTMIMAGSDGFEMTWTRQAGNAEDITGTWHYTNPRGSTYEFILRADSSFTLYGSVAESCFARVSSTHWESGYYISLSYQDPDRDATSVTVTGPGISGTLTLCYEDGRWNNWTPQCENLSLGLTPPEPPLVYIFTYTGSGGETRIDTALVDCFLHDLPSDLSPTGSISGTVTFSWTPLSVTGIRYQVQLNDPDGQRMWDSEWLIDASSIVYDGPALIAGNYHYYVAAQDETDACSSIEGEFFEYLGGK
jgi:hypothetical protein